MKLAEYIAIGLLCLQKSKYGNGIRERGGKV